MLSSVPVLLLAVQLLAGCGGPKPIALPRLPSDAKILAFGDSLTAGNGASPAQSYPSVLAGLIRREVVNAGVPGETTSGGLARLPQVLDEVQPQLVILCEGGNDMLRRQSKVQMRENLANMIREIQKRRITVVLLGVPEPALFGLDAEASYATLAEEFDLWLDEQTLPEILGDNARKADRIHPNARGYADLAQAVADLLRESGAL